MFYYLNKWLFPYETRVVACEERLDEMENKLFQLQEYFFLGNPGVNNNYDHYDSDSDGSNFGIFIKSRINKGTTIHYITGHTDRYNLRKDFYTDTECVMEKKCVDPSNNIEKFNQYLAENGLNVTYVTDTVVVTDGNCETVKNIIQKSDEVI
ncbi:38.7kD protein [Cryptophlebia leucotreta granulovirus]|uniref:38.7kD protein n=1 Tax=Cryptophlebia leucotreta granulosis virus TaxID=35254 RepID=Q7T5M4_GVCL|nr:38.7kD protein [Cryptophlebia leucotreta granulovirus]AAQ21660.1 38.7kD protein [Cryptophlebia leucotreta granulovirus]AUF82046.1 38.7kD protein [Cryptophlebia leucotreta granulovirus]